jgi:hypothetical protein
MLSYRERPACPVCRSTECLTLYRCGFTQEPLGSFLHGYYRQQIPEGLYQLDECQKCSLVFQRFVGTGAFLTELYSEWLTRGIDAHYRMCLAHFRCSRDGHELTTLSAYLNKRRLKVLDYGAGWGLWPIIAGRLGHDSYAVELAPEKAQWMASNGVTVLADEDLSHHSFDVINLEQTLEHLTEPWALLDRLIPSLDGILKVGVPNVRARRIVADLERGDTSSIHPVQPFEHVNGFTARALNTLANAFGLVEIRPSLAQRYAFLRGGVPRRPREVAKELIRPLVTFHTPWNLYRWFKAC